MIEKFRRHQKILVGASLIYFAIILFIYVVELYVLHTLPSSIEWGLRGYNHGPWRESWEGLLIGIVPEIILVITFLVTVYLSISTKNIKVFFKGVGLLVLQFALWAIVVIPIFWTID